MQKETYGERKIHPWLAGPLSVAAWILAVFVTIVLFLTGLFFGSPLSLLFDKGTRRTLHGVAQAWAAILIGVSPVWKLSVEGGEHVKRGPYVIVANHQSIVDILVVLAGIRTHFKFIAKKELFSVPFIGWHMALAGYIPLLRGNKESAKEAVEKARQYIRKGVSALFFPEGTRSLDGEIHEFKMGAFKIAAEEGAEILPVVLDGTGEAIPKHTWILRRPVRFKMRILKPIAPPSKDVKVIEAYRDAIREQIKRELEAIRSARP